MLGNGLFITFEGPEGSGKTTQIARLASTLRAHGHTVIETREPGGTPIGAQIRRILLDPAHQEQDRITELLLMYASRAQNLAEVIRPALAEGHIVVCDRFTDSTWAYQGGGRGIPEEALATLDSLVSLGAKPNATVLLDVQPEVGLARARERNQTSSLTESRFDDETLAFHSRVRAKFLDLSREEPNRIVVVDGSASLDIVAQSIWSGLRSLFPEIGSDWRAEGE